MTRSSSNETTDNSRVASRLRVTVVGAGALGNEVIKGLGLLNTRRIHVVDPDVVEPRNLYNSVFFRKSGAMGRPKAQVLQEAAGLFFPETEFLASCCEIADASGGLNGTDLIFSCVDSDLARLEIAYLSTLHHIPVVEGGLGSHQIQRGRITWFPGHGGACYGCKLPASQRRGLLTLWQANPQSCQVAEDRVDLPGTPTMAAIIGSMQVDLGLRSWLSAAKSSYSTEISLDDTPRLDSFQNRQAAGCPFHERQPETRVPIDERSTAEQVLEEAVQGGNRTAYVRLDWPVCTKARCGLCGFEWVPMLRAGFLRRRSACPRCQSAAIQMIEQVQTFQSGDSWAVRPLVEFGITPPQSVAVRAG